MMCALQTMINTCESGKTSFTARTVIDENSSFSFVD